MKTKRYDPCALLKPEDIAEIKHLFESETRRTLKRIGSLVLVGMALSGPISGEAKEEGNQGLSDNSGIETAGVTPSLGGDREDRLLSQFPDYAIKQQEIAKYKELLKEKGCQEINLEICAAGLYARNKSDGFKAPGVYDLWQKTILGDYITDEQIYEFGRTGKGLDVVYFRDKNGKKTKEPAIFYVATPDVKKYKISDIEKAIDFWEKPAPGFLRAMVANDVRFLFQGQASSNKKIQAFNFEWGIIFYNYCENDLSHFILGLKKGLAVEMFGEKADALGIYSKDEVGVIKSWLARDCCIYIGKKTGHKNIADRAGAFQKALDRYMSGGNLTYEYMDPIIKTIKKEGLITPFGAETWEEIDSVENPNKN